LYLLLYPNDQSSPAARVSVAVSASHTCRRRGRRLTAVSDSSGLPVGANADSQRRWCTKRPAVRSASITPPRVRLHSHSILSGAVCDCCGHTSGAVCGCSGHVFRAPLAVAVAISRLCTHLAHSAHPRSTTLAHPAHSSRPLSSLVAAIIAHIAPDLPAHSRRRRTRQLV